MADRFIDSDTLNNDDIMADDEISGLLTAIKTTHEFKQGVVKIVAELRANVEHERQVQRERSQPITVQRANVKRKLKAVLAAQEAELKGHIQTAVTV